MFYRWIWYLFYQRNQDHRDSDHSSQTIKFFVEFRKSTGSNLSRLYYFSSENSSFIPLDSLFRFSLLMQIFPFSSSLSMIYKKFKIFALTIFYNLWIEKTMMAIQYIYIYIYTFFITICNTFKWIVLCFVATLHYFRYFWH